MGGTIIVKNPMEQYGKFPAEGRLLRKEKTIVVISESRRLKLLHGDKANVLCQIAVSNDYIHEGLVTIPARAHSEADRFSGDAVFMPTRGVVSFTVEESEGGRKPVSRERFEVKAREKFFLPANTYFRMHNFSAHKVDVVFIAAAGRRKRSGP
jgi:hypothetical protein